MTEKRKIELPKLDVTYKQYSEARPGDLLVLGRYKGARMKDGLKKDENGTPIKVPSHGFEDLDNPSKLTVLNSSKALNDLLEQVEVGSVVEVVFGGLKKFKSKEGQPMKSYEFEVSVLDEEPSF